MTGCRRLEGRVAVITGAGSGMGAATARRLASEGASVAIGDLNGKAAKAVADEIGSAAIGVEFDAGDVSSVEALIGSAVDRFGRLDILHNNAAIMDPNHFQGDTNPVDIDFDVWDRTFDVNVRGYVAGVKYAVPHMLEAGGGSIIMTASGSANLGDIANIAYGASKGAIVTFVKYVATIYGKQNIRCNGINPGVIRTEGSVKALPAEVVKIMERHTMYPRLGKPEDIAGLVSFLASDDAAYVNGTIIDVDGGIDQHQPWVADFLDAFGAEGNAIGKV